MSIIGTFNGLNIVSLPCDTMPGVCAPSSMEIDPQEAVAVNVSPFTFQTQAYDWQASMWAGQVSLPPMARYSFDAWSAFILSCRGQSNVFSLGDPKAVLPKGPATGTPVVSGAAQTGYSLVTRGWSVASPLANPAFWLGNTGWAYPPSWAIQTGSGPGGEPYTAKYEGPGTNPSIYNANNVACTAGQTLTASCMSWGASPATGSPVCFINFFSSSGTYLSGAYSAPNPSADGIWRQLTATATAPTGAAYAQIGCQIQGSSVVGLWQASEFVCTNPSGGPVSVLLPGDLIQIGYRMYKLTAPANVDGNGNSTLSIWPNLRDQPADGVTIQTRNCKCLFRLAHNSGNKWSTNTGAYGLSGFGISEAI